MTEAAKREDAIENEATNEIAADDPLFELSQIMGLDDVAPEPTADLDPQIDLEDALLAEMAMEPEFEAPSVSTDDPAPTAESLEDELTTMLGGAVSVAAEVPAPDVETTATQEMDPTSDEVAAPASFEQVDDELEAVQLNEAVSDIETELGELPTEYEALASLDDGLTQEATEPDSAEAYSEPVEFSEEVVPTQSFETPFDAELDTDHNPEEPQDAVSEQPEALADDAAMSLEEAEIELERDFAAFFDEELPDADLAPDFEADATPDVDEDVTWADDAQDPMDVLADMTIEEAPESLADTDADAEFVAEEGSQAEFAEPETLPEREVEVEDAAEMAVDHEPEMASVADVEAVTADIEHLNAGIEKIFGEQVSAVDEMAEPVEPELPAAPILETTDMSSYEAANAVEVDVPELPDLENEFVAAFEGDTQTTDTSFEEDTSEPSHDIAAAIGATVAAAGATVLSRRAGETAMAADDEAFDETRFEAELARDMEFVGHDLGTADGDEASSSDEFEDQAFAAQAAANAGNKRGLVIAAVLGCVAIVGAAGIFYANSNSAADGTDGPVLVEASPDPVKIEPENPGGKLVPNQDRAVFAENVVVPEQEALVPGVEEPVDIAAVPEAALPSNLNGGDAAQKGDDRLTPQATETTATNDEIGALIAPRRVRTLVVRPDGTLVERAVVPTPEPVVSTPEPAPEAPATPEVVAAIPEPVAPAAPIEVLSEPVAIEPAEEASSETVIVPEAPGNDVPQAQASEPESNEVVAAAPAAPEIAPANPEPTPEVSAPEVAAAPAVEAAAPATNVARTINNPPTIANRPNDQPLNIVNPTEELANTQVASAPTPAATTTAAASPFSVQLASLPSQASAQNTANNLAQQFSSVIGGRGLVIREAQIEGRGTFYRVRVGAANRTEANQLCGQIKAAGGDCFVTR